MLKKIAILAGVTVIAGCKIAEVQTVDESSYTSAYETYQLAEQLKTSDEERSVQLYRQASDQFLQLIQEFPASGKFDDAHYYCGRSLIAAAELDGTQRKLDSTLSIEEFRRGISSLNSVPEKSSRWLNASYYVGYGEYRIWSIDTSLSSDRSESLNRFSSLITTVPNQENVPFATYYTGQIYRKSSTPNHLDTALIWFDKSKQYTATKGNGTFWGAVVLQDLNRNSEAVSRFNEYRTSFSTEYYANAATYGSAYCSYLQGDTTTSGKIFYTTAIATFNKFVTTYTSSDSLDNARLYGGHCYRKTGDRVNAQAWYVTGISAGDGSKKGDCTYWAGMNAYAQNDFTTASLYLNQYVTGYTNKSVSFDDTAYYTSATNTLAVINSNPEIVAYNGALALYTAKNYAAASDSFSVFITKYPSSTKLDAARYYAGRSNQELADTNLLTTSERVTRYMQAISFYGKVGTGYTSYEMSRYYYGSCAYETAKLDVSKKNYYDTAITLYGTLLKSNSSFIYSTACQIDIGFSYRNKTVPNLDSALTYFTKVDTGSTGSYWKAVTLQDLKQYATAVTQYNSYSLKFPNGFYAGSALYRSAYCSYLLGTSVTSGTSYFATAITQFNAFITKFTTSDSLDNARLYGGHCYRKTGDKQNASIWYESGITVGDGSKKGDCTYWAGVLYDQLNNTTKMDLYLNQYISKYDTKTVSFDNATYYADAKKRLGL